MEFPTLSVVRPAHQANQSAMAAEVTDRLWERNVARHYPSCGRGRGHAKGQE